MYSLVDIVIIVSFCRIGFRNKNYLYEFVISIDFYKIVQYKVCRIRNSKFHILHQLHNK